MYLDASRASENADHEVSLRWRALREDLEQQGADAGTFDAVQSAVDEHPYQPGRYGLAVFARAGEVCLVETLSAPSGRSESSTPRSMRGGAEDPDPAAGMLDDCQYVQSGASERHRLDEVRRQQRVSLRAQELCQGRGSPIRCGIDPGHAKNLPHRRCGDLHAEGE
jgi:hypothetical protein